MFKNTIILIALFSYNLELYAWGTDGHSATGILAMAQLQNDVRDKLDGIIGTTDARAMTQACNWPDAIRDTEKWQWSAPQHYINIPRGEYSYSKTRDCPQGLCATEAIKKYAHVLANTTAENEQRKQAFNWLCHLMGDLHQPLHVGYADDRGGNEFEVTFAGEAMGLHAFWDTALIKSRAASRDVLVKQLNQLPPVFVAYKWSAESVNRWTDQSHELAKAVYPHNRILTQQYQDQSWNLIQQRIRFAGARLAFIINSILRNEG